MPARARKPIINPNAGVGAGVVGSSVGVVGSVVAGVVGGAVVGVVGGSGAAGVLSVAVAEVTWLPKTSVATK